MEMRAFKKCVSWALLAAVWTYPAILADNSEQPNIVFIMADDMGWNDVSFHGSDQIQTANIDSLAYDAVVLQRYYTHCLCTPSRAAMLTGKYAHRTGMQGYPLTNSEDRGIPLSEKLLPAYLKDMGYETHLVGKWHVGASRTAYLPMERGFDSHFGYRNGAIDYYEYLATESWTEGEVSGLDLYDNMTAAWSVEGYITDVLTDRAVTVIKEHCPDKPLFLQVMHAAPHCSMSGALLQAPPDAVRKNRHVETPERRQYAGLMTKLDESIGAIVQALYDNNILNNTVIIFVSDNGGMSVGLSRNWASNYPLRGEKFTPFEGGVRTTGFIWSSKLDGKVWSGLMHVTDWLPTLISAAGGAVPNDIDGVDQWLSIKNNGESKRKNIVLEIDDYDGFAAIIQNDYKLITGTVDVNYSGYLGTVDNLLGVIGETPPYLDVVRSSSVSKVLAKIGRGADEEKISEIRKSVVINCDQSHQESCVPDANRSCLYNILRDPCEQHDLSISLPSITSEIEALIKVEWASRLPRIVPLFRDPGSDPRLHNNTWAPWMDAKA